MRIVLLTVIDVFASSANVVRQLSLAKLCQALGHDVQLLGVAHSFPAGERLREGVPCATLPAPKGGYFRRGRRLDAAIRDALCAREQAGHIDWILLSDTYAVHSLPIREHARRHGTRVCVNCVEWYAASTLLRRRMGLLRLLQNRWALRVLFPRYENIIAISTLLDDYYRRRGCRTVLIPTIVDTRDYAGLDHGRHDGLQLAYAGRPGRKDLIGNVIRALALLDDAERSRVTLSLYGADANDLRAAGVTPGELAAAGDSVRLMGRLPQEEVKAAIARADFTVLLRPGTRSSNAGFPTKVGESMAAGVPVIANLTSDLARYVRDGETGLVCRDGTPEACAQVLARALALGPEAWAAMRDGARREAEKSFDFRRYEAAMAAFLADNGKGA